MATYNYPRLRLLWDRKHKCGDGGKGLIDLEISYLRKRKWISTGVTVERRHWRDGKVSGCPDMLRLNMRLTNIVKQYEALLLDLEARGIPFTWEALEAGMMTDADGEVVCRRMMERESFLDWMDDRIASRDDLRAGTLTTHRVCLDALRVFGRIVKFADLTPKNVLLWDEWLRAKGIAQVSVYSYHKRLKRYINEAICDGLMDNNPYRRVKIARGTCEKRRFLVKEDVDRIAAVRLPTESLRRVRDCFLFQCYTGLAYADLRRFDFREVVEIEGRYYLHSRRQKTNEDYQVMLLRPAVDILKRYKYVLPVMSNAQYNMRLKLVQEAAGIELSLTSHMGRHTFACLAINSGVRIEVLAQMMGHANIRTTQIYAKIFNTSVNEGYLRLEDALTGKEKKKKSV